MSNRREELKSNFEHLKCINYEKLNLGDFNEATDKEYNPFDDDGRITFLCDSEFIEIDLHFELLKVYSSLFCLRWLNSRKLEKDNSFNFLREKPWKLERLGNYIYGSLISFFYSWRALEDLKKHTHKEIDIISTDISTHVFVRLMFTGLDAVSLCIYILENGEKNNLDKKCLRGISFNRIFNAESKQLPEEAYKAYRDEKIFIDSKNFKYLGEYRNQLTHRPFIQYNLKRDKNGTRLYLPKDEGALKALDSEVQNKNLYKEQEDDIINYFNLAEKELMEKIKNILDILAERYRKKLNN
jgi:hypothetical protein